MDMVSLNAGIVFVALVVVAFGIVDRLLSHAERRRQRILGTLLSHGPMTCVQLVARIGGYAGTLYPVMRALERRGVICSFEEASPQTLAVRGGYPRRVYYVPGTPARLHLERPRA